MFGGFIDRSALGNEIPAAAQIAARGNEFRRRPKSRAVVGKSVIDIAVMPHRRARRCPST
jgi:hypothetical protein